MSAASHLPTLVGTASAGALIAGLTSLPRVRALLAAYLGHGALRKMLTIAACAYALANLKNLPGLWRTASHSELIALERTDKNRRYPGSTRDYIPGLLPTHQATATTSVRTYDHVKSQHIVRLRL